MKPSERLEKYTILGSHEAADVMAMTAHNIRLRVRRGSFPLPDVELACGPIWLADSIREWIKAYEIVKGFK